MKQIVFFIQNFPSLPVREINALWKETFSGNQSIRHLLPTPLLIEFHLSRFSLPFPWQHGSWARSRKALRVLWKITPNEHESSLSQTAPQRCCRSIGYYLKTICYSCFSLLLVFPHPPIHPPTCDFAHYDFLFPLSFFLSTSYLAKYRALGYKRGMGEFRSNEKVLSETLK